MQPVPDYDSINNLSSQEKDTLVTTMYISAALFVVLLLMAIYNIWAFLIK